MAAESPGQSDALTTWANVSYERFKDSNQATAGGGEKTSVFAGVDYKVLPKLRAGLMLGTETSDLRSDVNGSRTDAKGWLAMPYASYSITDWLVWDTSVGYGRTYNDQQRDVDLGGGLIQTVGGDFTTRRWLAQTGLTANVPLGHVLLSPRIGYSYALSRSDDFTESNGTYNEEQRSHLARGEAGLRVGYWLAPVMPFVSATYSYDFVRDQPGVGAQTVTLPRPTEDEDAVVFVGGVTYVHSQALFATLSYSTEEFRDDYADRTWSANLTLRF